jgi:hypothetical protein
VIPWLFLTLAVVLTVSQVVSSPGRSLIGLAVIGAGGLVWALGRKQETGKREQGQPGAS